MPQIELILSRPTHLMAIQVVTSVFRMMYGGIKWHLETKVRLRKDSRFSDMVDQEHHIGNSPLSGLVQIQMVSMFPSDHMHLCCLGVTRKLIHYWFKGKLAIWVPSKTVEIISNKLQMLRSYTPCGLRGLSEIALESYGVVIFHVVLGLVVLRDSSSVSCTITSCCFLVAVPWYFCGYVGVCTQVDIVFCWTLWGLVWKRWDCVKVNQLIHLSEEYRKFGTLDNS